MKNYKITKDIREAGDKPFQVAIPVGAGSRAVVLVHKYEFCTGLTRKEGELKTIKKFEYAFELKGYATKEEFYKTAEAEIKLLLPKQNTNEEIVLHFPQLENTEQKYFLHSLIEFAERERREWNVRLDDDYMAFIIM